MKYKDFKMMSKGDMKQVIGGSEGGNNLCWITTSGPGYSNPETNGVLFSEGCPGSSTQANAYCVNLIATPGTGVYHCSYNCGCIS